MEAIISTGRPYLPDLISNFINLLVPAVTLYTSFISPENLPSLCCQAPSLPYLPPSLVLPLSPVAPRTGYLQTLWSLPKTHICVLQQLSADLIPSLCTARLSLEQRFSKKKSKLFQAPAPRTPLEYRAKSVTSIPQRHQGFSQQTLSPLLVNVSGDARQSSRHWKGTKNCLDFFFYEAKKQGGSK